VGDPSGLVMLQVLMDKGRLQKAVARIAAGIVKRHPKMANTVLVGIRTRGVPLAHRIARHIGEAAGFEPPVGALDITLYRDDLTTIAAQPVIKGTEIPGSIDGRAVILVDDVLFTGRTLRAALDELIDFGRPSRIELAVIADRGHRELPIHADYVGMNVETAREEIVQVKLLEEDGEDEVLLLGRQAPRRTPRAKTRPKKAMGRGKS